MPVQNRFNDVWIARCTQDTVDLTSVVQVRTPDGFFTHPVISPDGCWVAFWGECKDSVDVWIADTNGGRVKNVTAGTGLNGHPTWAPDSRSLAFFNNTVPKQGSYSPPYGLTESQFGKRDIWTIDIATSTRKRLTQDDFDNERPAWSPDGRRIAYVSARGGNQNLWSVDVGGGEPRQITHQPGVHYRPAWHPEGTCLAFNNKGPGSHYLWIVNADGRQEPRQLTPTSNTKVVHDHGAWWSSDGREILFHSDRGGSYGLWVIDPEGGDLRPIALPTFTQVGHATWDARERFLSFDAPRGARR